MSQPQSASNHAKIVFGYHRVTTALLVLPMGYFGYRMMDDFSVDRLAMVMFAWGVLGAALYGRLFPLGVQDRVIRLEERLRLERILPADMKGRIDELTTDHLVGLRFASDDEVGDLTRRVLAGELADRKAIKSAVKSWRADHQRI